MTTGTRPRDPLVDLRTSECSNGAPSARNLIVTVFGDALLPHGRDTEISVKALGELLAGFGVNDRLVRTSLTRLVNDGLLATRVEGRRSFYRVDDDSIETFRRADRRIYQRADDVWDGVWTIAIVDGAEGTADERSALRQELAWAGLGAVAPNVMASPVVEPEVASEVVARHSDRVNVLLTRSAVVEGAGALTSIELARRCAPVDDLAADYTAFVRRFERFTDLGRLEPAEAFKLRILVVASFRRLVLADPVLPSDLLPAAWIGATARRVAGAVYRRVAADGERFLIEHAEPALDRPAPDLDRRFTGERGASAR